MVAVASVKGSPGVTTIAALLAASWPGTPVVMIEADPSGGDLSSWFRTSPEPGMVTLAASARHSAPLNFADHVQNLPGGLPVLLMPPGAQSAENILRLLPTTVIQAIKASTDVVVDVGRLHDDSARWTSEADVLLIALRGGVADLMHVRERASVLADAAPLVGLVVVGGPDALAIDAASETGLSLIGRVPIDDRAAAVLRGEGTVRNWPGTDLVRTVHAIAGGVHASVIRPQAPEMEAAG